LVCCCHCKTSQQCSPGTSKSFVGQLVTCLTTTKKKHKCFQALLLKVNVDYISYNNIIFASNVSLCYDYDKSRAYWFPTRIILNGNFKVIVPKSRVVQVSRVSEQVWSITSILAKPSSSNVLNFIVAGFYRAGGGSSNAPDMSSGSREWELFWAADFPCWDTRDFTECLARNAGKTRKPFCKILFRPTIEWLSSHLIHFYKWNILVATERVQIKKKPFNLHALQLIC
jgi:hypothetical protein